MLNSKTRWLFIAVAALIVLYITSWDGTRLEALGNLPCVEVKERLGDGDIDVMPGGVPEVMERALAFAETLAIAQQGVLF